MIGARRISWLWIALAACGSSTKDGHPTVPPPALDEPQAAVAIDAAPPPAPAPASTCDDLPAAVERVLRGQIAQMPVDAKPQAEAAVGVMLPRIKLATHDACAEDGWSAAAITCMAHPDTTAAWEACASELTPAQQQGLQQRLSAAAQPDVAATPPPVPYDLAPDVGIAECDAYLRAIDRAVLCDKLDDVARDAARSAAADQKQAWVAMPKKTAKQRKTIARSCQGAMKTLRDAAAGAGCPWS